MEQRTEEEKHNQAIKYLLYKIYKQEAEKKPHNIRIKNNNPKEPKIKENKHYTAKFKYKVYKTKIEPKLHDKIMIDEDDDIVAELKKEFDDRNRHVLPDEFEISPVKQHGTTREQLLSNQSLIIDDWWNKKYGSSPTKPDNDDENMDRLSREIGRKLDFVNEVRGTFPMTREDDEELTGMTPRTRETIDLLGLRPISSKKIENPPLTTPRIRHASSFHDNLLGKLSGKTPEQLKEMEKERKAKVDAREKINNTVKNHFIRDSYKKTIDAADKINDTIKNHFIRDSYKKTAAAASKIQGLYKIQQAKKEKQRLSNMSAAPTEISTPAPVYMKKVRQTRSDKGVPRKSYRKRGVEEVNFKLMEAGSMPPDLKEPTPQKKLSIGAKFGKTKSSKS